MNFTTTRSSPIQIPGTSWSEVGNGGQIQISLARKSDGTLWSWGQNNQGQLGDGTITQRSSPIQIPGTNWSEIAGGFSHSLALKGVPIPSGTAGQLWSWGYNNAGELGDGTRTYRSSPVQVPGTS